MEHAAAYPLVLFSSLTSAITLGYRRHRALTRVQRGLRFYLGHTA